MKVAVGSTNPVKLEAVRQAFAIMWPDEQFEFVSANIPSGVSHQPMAESESIKGALNRAKTAKVTFKPDYSIGIEGGLAQAAGHWFVDAWAVAINLRGEEGIGSSGRTELAPRIMDLVQAGKELGDAEDIVFGRSNTKQAEGYIGFLSDGALDRTRLLRDAVIMALVRFKQPEVFET